MKNNNTNKKIPLPINLEVFYFHGINDANEIKQNEMRAVECAQVSESFFMLINELLDHTIENDNEISRRFTNEEMFFAIFNLAAVGRAYANKCAHFIDLADISRDKETEVKQDA